MVYIDSTSARTPTIASCTSGGRPRNGGAAEISTLAKLRKRGGHYRHFGPGEFDVSAVVINQTCIVVRAGAITDGIAPLMPPLLHYPSWIMP
jgi:hypothetical protein